MCAKQRHANHTLLGDIPPPPLHSKIAGMRLFLVGFDNPTLGVEGTCHGNSCPRMHPGGEGGGGYYQPIRVYPGGATTSPSGCIRGRGYYQPIRVYPGGGLLPAYPGVSGGATTSRIWGVYYQPIRVYQGGGGGTTSPSGCIRGGGGYYQPIRVYPGGGLLPAHPGISRGGGYYQPIRVYPGRGEGYYQPIRVYPGGYYQPIWVYPWGYYQPNRVYPGGLQPAHPGVSGEGATTSPSGCIRGGGGGATTSPSGCILGGGGSTSPPDEYSVPPKENKNCFFHFTSS